MPTYPLTRDTQNKNRYSIPLSIQNYERPQDTNYIGITITDQEGTETDLNTTWRQHEPDSVTPQSYRHSFNNIIDLPNLQQQKLGYWQGRKDELTPAAAPVLSMSLPQLNITNRPLHSQPLSTNIPFDHVISTLSSLSVGPDISQQSSHINKSSQCSPSSTPDLVTAISAKLTPASPLSLLPQGTSTIHSTSSHQPILTVPIAPTSTTCSSSISGAFRKVSDYHNLIRPALHRPYFSTPIKPLLSLTKNLNRTYQKCNQGFQYNATRNPRRVLTKPCKPGGNDGYDNEDFDYILYVNDILGSTDGHRYIILDVLGSGTFGQVVKCKNTKTQEMVAVKVVKNKLAYFKQSMMEVTILEMLNQQYDVNDQHHILRLKDTFIHRKHLCLIFELMSVNLYELIKQNQFNGLSTNLVRVFTAQILDSLTVLNEAKVIHCDLKPENILLRSLESPTIKVIDFGSACHEVQTMYTYIQSRFYRSPEVLVGLPYTSAIDMWSLGCIAAELFLGLPLFPGSSEYNQVSRIVELLGLPPAYMIEMGKTAHHFFNRRLDDRGRKQYDLKTMEQYAMEQEKQEHPSKRYFKASSLSELITTYPVIRKDSMSSKDLEKETQNRHAFVDFLQGLLNLNHLERWSPQQAKQHPFITGEPFTGPFTPSFAPQHQSHTNNQHQTPSPSAEVPDPHISYSSQQIPISIDYSTDLPIQIEHDPQQNDLSPAYSSLPNFYTDCLSQQQGQKKQQPSSHDTRLLVQYEEDGIDLENNMHGDNDSFYIIPQIMETSEDRSSTLESTFIPSLRVHHQVNDLSYQQRSEMNSPPSSPVLQQQKESVSTSYVDSQQGILENYHHHSASDTNCRTRELTDFTPSSSSNPTNILSSVSMTGNPYRQYPPGHDATINLPSMRANSQAANLQHTSKDQSPHRYHDSGCRNRPSTWLSGTRNMTSIDLERDADWMEERDSPPLEPLISSIYMSSTPSPLPLAHTQNPSSHPHRRSHSHTLFADVTPPFNTGTSVLSRSSMASNVASLHRRVRGHPHLNQAYHRQDLEWDGVHTILPY